MAVCSATTLIGPTRLAVRLAGAGSGRAWRGHDERAAEREEQEQRRGDSLCEVLRAGRHRFPPLCVGHNRPRLRVAATNGAERLARPDAAPLHGRLPLGEERASSRRRPGVKGEIGLTPRWSRSAVRALVPRAAACGFLAGAPLDSAVVRYHFSDRTLLRCGF